MGREVYITGEMLEGFIFKSVWDLLSQTASTPNKYSAKQECRQATWKLAWRQVLSDDSVVCTETDYQ